jgi:glycosyltransferase involved in cell wall biosynthesis
MTEHFDAVGVNAMTHTSDIRVLHVAEMIVGGIATHFEEMIPLQAAMLGAENIRLIVPGDSVTYLPFASDIRVDGFPTQSNRVRGAWELAKAMRRAREEWRPHIIHAHSSFGGVATRLLGGAGRERVVYCAHGWAFAQHLPEWKRRSFATLERVQLRRTDAVINVSQHEHDLAHSYGVRSADKMVVMPNGIAAAEPVCAKPVPLQRRPDAGPSEIDLVFVGRFAHAKGIDILDRAARLLADRNVRVTFHLVGSHAHGQAPAFADCPPNVILYGWRTRAETVSMIAQATAIVMPSRWEGLPIAGLEAMRSGKALIASNCSAFPEIIDHGRTGLLFEMGNAAALADMIAATTPRQLATMGTNAAARFQRYYTSDRQAADMIALYRRLTATAT